MAGSELDHGTAVHHKRLTSTPLGLPAHEVLHGRIEVGRLPESFDDVVGFCGLNRVLAALVLAPRGDVHEAWRHAVDGDAIRAELTRKVPRDLMHRELAGRVHAGRLERAVRGHVDDA